MIQPRRATIADLYEVEGKAELIGGKVVEVMASGWDPSSCGFNVAIALNDYRKRTGRGKAFADGMGYAIPILPSGRESFSPDASFYDGPKPTNAMRFIDGPPTFAVEVRCENDYGPAAETELAAKRADYFAAGTSVVWDVDPLAKTVALYRATAPDQPTVFHAGEVADAEPAVPGWRMPVADVFAP
jgi:Uma2 family endonuclease